jgi:hypothetical protein
LLKKYLTANTGSLVVNLLTQFFTISIISSKLGFEGLGFWFLCQALISYTLMANLGLVEAVGTHISNNCNPSFLTKAFGYYCLVAKLQFISFLVISLIIFITLNFFDWVGIFSFPTLSAKLLSFDILILFICLILYALTSQKFSQLSIPARYLCVYDIHIWYSSVLKVIELILLALFLFASFTLDFFFMASILIRVIFYFRLREKIKLVGVFFIHNDPKIPLRDLLSILHGIGSTITQIIINALLNQILVSSIARLYGVAEVGMLGALRTYSRSILKFSSLLSNTLIPIYAHSSHKQFFSGWLNRRQDEFFLMILFLIAFCAYIISPIFIEAWIKVESQNLERVFLIALIFESFGLGVYQILTYRSVATNSNLWISIKLLLALLIGLFGLLFLKVHIEYIFFYIGFVSIAISIHFKVFGR